MIRRQILMAGFSCAALLLASATALAGTIKVPKDYETIGEALANAEAGDTIAVSKGVYRENIEASLPDGVRLIGKKAVIDGGFDDGDILKLDGNNLTIQGFIFKFGSSDQIDINGDNALVTKCIFRSAYSNSVEISGDNARVEKCKIRGGMRNCVNINGDNATVSGNDIRHANPDYDDDYGAAIWIEGSDCLVEKNTISNISAGAIWISDGGGDRSDGRETATGGLITKNKIRNIEDDGVHLGMDEDSDYGVNGVEISRNTFNNLDGEGVAAEYCDDLEILQNKFTNISNQGVELEYCDNALVEKNTMVGTEDGGIDACYCPGIRILDNNIRDAIDGEGISIYDEEEEAGGEISGNTISDTERDGIYLYASDFTVTGNRIANVGVDCREAGIYVYGHNNEFSGNSVVTTGGHGIWVYGDQNSFHQDSVTDCGYNGFQLDPTCSDNVLESVRATNCDGEGLQNRSFNTDVTRSTFTGNRTDVTNDGSFEQTDGEFESSNNYATGGPNEESEVSCDNN